MTRWIVMRHAKTEREPAHDDIRRSLTEEGHEVARRQGHWLAAQGWIPDHIICSPATRAQQTMQDVMGTWPRPLVHTVDALYGGGLDTYLDALTHADGHTIMLVGHDPTCTQVIEDLAPDAPRKDNGKVMPTGAVACFEDGRLVDLHWP